MNAPLPPPIPAPPPRSKSPALALCLAFLPAGMLLGVMMFRLDTRRNILLGACFLSVLCCFTSSFMLFARRTGLAILGGVLFLILNGVIALFLGCIATIHIQM